MTLLVWFIGIAALLAACAFAFAAIITGADPHTRD